MPNILTDIGNALKVVVGVLTGIGGSGLIPAQKQTQIATILADLTKIAADGGQPGDALLTDVAQLFTDLKVEGFISGTVVDDALNVLQKFGAAARNYLSGQAAIVDSNFSYGGVSGDLIAISKGGSAAQSLGM